MKENNRILIVDDDPDISEVLQLTFEAVGYLTRVVRESESTLEVTRQYDPHAVILDVLLSGQDGRTICQQLKKDAHTGAIPIIMISAHPDAATSSLAAGADHFMAKPFNIFELIEKVDSFTSVRN